MFDLLNVSHPIQAEHEPSISPALIPEACMKYLRKISMNIYLRHTVLYTYSNNKVNKLQKL